MRDLKYRSKKTFQQSGTGHGQLGRYFVLDDKGGKIMKKARAGSRKSSINVRDKRRKHGRGY